MAILERKKLRFSLPVQMYRTSYCSIHGVGSGVGIGVDGGVGVSKVLKYYVKVFYVMGKAVLYEDRLFCHFYKWGWGHLL